VRVLGLTSIIMAALLQIAPLARAPDGGGSSGEGHCFEVTNSTYLNVTLCSTAAVNVTLESVPRVVSFTIKAVGSSVSTDITLSGLSPGGTYYRYENGYFQESFVTDGMGGYAYAQDLSRPHHIYFAEHRSTMYISDSATGGDCSIIGMWDGPTKTCTLTRSVGEQIVLDSDGLTLDGNGYSVYPGDFGAYGVYTSSRSSLAVRNVGITPFTYYCWLCGGYRTAYFGYGIYLFSSDGSTVSGSTVSAAGTGIYLSSSPSGTVSGNTVSGGGTGIRLDYSSGIVSANTVSAARTGIYLSSSPGSTVSVNTVQNTYGTAGIYLASSHASTVSGNTITGATYGIYLYYTSGTVSDNTISASTGVYVYSSGSSTVSGNTVSGGSYGVYVYSSGSSTVSGNTVSGGSYGVYLYASGSSTVSGNTVSSYYGIYMDSSGSSTVIGNTLSGYHFIGIFLSSSGSSTVIGNTASGGSSGIYLVDSPGALVDGNSVSASFSGIQQDASSPGLQALQNDVWGGYIGIYLQSSGGLIEGNTASAGVIALGLFNPGSSTVSSTVRDNTLTARDTGIDLRFGGGHIITRNAIGIWGTSGSLFGIIFRGASFSTIVENTITMSRGSGFHSDLGAHHNVIENNGITVGFGVGVGAAFSGGGDQIRGNVITMAWGDGIFYDRAGCCNTMAENEIIAAGIGGIRVFGTCCNTMEGNAITGAQVTGARVGISLEFFAGSNVIVANSITRTGTGLSMWDVGGNRIASNLFADNGVGMHIGFAGRQPVLNAIYENCFMRNAAQLSLYNVGSTQQWNNPARVPRPWGNHWSDYAGRDLDGDGIGDTNLPHQGVDNDPLMGPSMPNFGRVCAGNGAPLLPKLSASLALEGEPTILTAVTTDPENDPLTYSFDFEDDGTWDLVGLDNTATRVWGDDHAGTARVRVCDAEFCMEDTAPVVVSNAVPELMVTVGEAVEGSPLEVSFRVTDSGSDDLTATLDWGESVDAGTYLVGVGPDPDESTDVNPRDVSDAMSHVYADDTYRVGTLTVADDDGGFVVVDFVILVVNGEPQVTTATISDGDEAEPVAFTGAARDPGADDLTVCWDWDDTTSECRTYINDGTFPFHAIDSGTHVWGDDATYDVELTVTDDDGGSVRVTLHTVIANVAPVPSMTLDAISYFEGSPATVSGLFTEQGTDDVTLTWTWLFGPTESLTFYNNGASPDPLKSPAGNAPFVGADTMAHTYDDDGVFSLTMEACDDDGGCASTTLPVPVQNLDPVAIITAPAPGSVYAIGEPVTFIGAFTDLGTGDTHVAVWSFDSTTVPATVTETGGSGTVEATYAFSAAGIYLVTLTVLDDDGGAGTANTVEDLTAFVVIYDPNGGFVTGGGWINSPPGAYLPSPTLTGKATFGFVAKYQKGASTPTGQTEFQFKAGDLNFHSTSYDWLVCGGPKCKFKGQGTINGVEGYSFMLTAIDGQLPGGGGEDKIRMKIWVTLTGEVVYDNQAGADEFADPTTVLGGGNIVIHRG